MRPVEHFHSILMHFLDRLPLARTFFPFCDLWRGLVRSLRLVQCSKRSCLLCCSLVSFRSLLFSLFGSEWFVMSSNVTRDLRRPQSPSSQTTNNAVFLFVLLMSMGRTTQIQNWWESKETRPPKKSTKTNIYIVNYKIHVLLPFFNFWKTFF